MEEQQAKSLNRPCSILALILTVMVIDLLLIFRDFYSYLQCFVQPLLQVLGMACPALFCPWASEEPDPKGPQPELSPVQEYQIDQILDGKSVEHEVKLSGIEVKLVMDRLGISCNPEEADRLPEGVESVQIEGLFDEQEPSLEEVKAAFDVFDKNHDGFVDARELCSFLCSFGFFHISEDICRGMIRAFDDNGDGLIDLREFTKLVEKGLH